jgi:pyruvate dehydrogenase E1 component alpha subunit
MAMAPELLCRLYRDMYRIRRVEEVIADLYPQQQMRCPVHLCIGQEATPVGVCARLGTGDYAFSTHRSHGHYLAKGGSLLGLLAELYGRRDGCSMGKGGSMHLIDQDCGFLGAAPILGATIALAVGAGFGNHLRGEDRVTVAFFGDAAIEEGGFYESASFAALHRLPVVLVCENNQLSTCSPLSVRQPAGRSIADLARAIGLTASGCDGNDVVEVYGQAGEAVDRARAGGGPTFLECHTFRVREHCGPHFDYDQGFRTRAEVEDGQKRCPIERLRRHLVNTGAWDDHAMAQMARDIEDEIAETVRAAQASPYPERSLLMADVYAPDPAASVAGLPRAAA